MNPLSRLFIILLVGFCLGSAVASGQSAAPQWTGDVSDWNGFQKTKFTFDGHSAYVVQPKTSAPGNPWVWRARFPEFHIEADLELLERGFHVARVNTDGQFGSPRAMEVWDQFYQHMVDHGLADKVALEGVSRGGLFVYGFASRWPERVACIYCDTPVCDIRSWPGGLGVGKGDARSWQRCLQEYGISEDSIESFRGSPIDRVQPIVEAAIPILHIVSLNDVIVPPTENTFVLQQRVEEFGGTMQIIKVAEGTSQSGGHHFQHPDPMRVADFIELHASVLPAGDDYFVLRGQTPGRHALDNCRIKFQTLRKGRVAFMGGSITAMSGWRQSTMRYLQDKFPDTEFEFIDAGISSTGSVPGAFRLNKDVLAHGPIDLFFEEAAVNDLHNMRQPTEMVRGMEGILRRARQSNPEMDVVVMHFVDPNHMEDYRAGRVPQVIQQHERVAEHYGISTLHLAREVTERIDAEQFDWTTDFKNLHPSPYGHRIYASSIRRMLTCAWSQPLGPTTESKPHAIPNALDRFSYSGGELRSPEYVKAMNGFEFRDSVDPRVDGVGGRVREGFSEVPMLVGRQPGDSFDWEFEGRGIGLFVAAGPDAGMIEFSIDNGPWRSKDLFTKWSSGLHIPWAYVLADELPHGHHQLRVRIAKERNDGSKGHACRIVHVMENR